MALLYLIYVSDPFTDDTTIFHPHENPEDASKYLEFYLKKLEKRLMMWKICANESKSCQNRKTYPLIINGATTEANTLTVFSIIPIVPHSTVNEGSFCVRFLSLELRLLLYYNFVNNIAISAKLGCVILYSVAYTTAT